MMDRVVKTRGIQIVLTSPTELEVTVEKIQLELFKNKLQWEDNKS